MRSTARQVSDAIEWTEADKTRYTRLSASKVQNDNLKLNSLRHAMLVETD